VALTPDGRHYVTWLTRLFRLVPHEVTQLLVQHLYGRLPHDTHPTHFRLNTPAQIDRTARRAGLRLAGLRRFANADYFSFAPRLRRYAIVSDWLLEKICPGLGRVYLVVTLEKPLTANRAAA
jgi:hypothetical protein